MRECFISRKPLEYAEGIRASDLRQGLFEFIKDRHPGFNSDCYISYEELNRNRRLYLTSLIITQKKMIGSFDKDVLDAIGNDTILSENIERRREANITFGQKLADNIATFGGSWKFIISFFIFILGWIVLNILPPGPRAFDAYPFILLNLILSCLAAIQAPIIMMSQNRKEQKDRRRSEHDYKINLKAELEIKLLSEKMDYLLEQQNKKLLEIQEIQTDYLEDLLKEIRK
jgi:uncharacterized membrane protein